MLTESTELDSLPTLDLHGEAFLADPVGVLGALLARSPIARRRRGLEVLSHDLQMEIFADQHFDTPDTELLIRKGTPPAFTAFLKHGFLLGMQGERHHTIRRVIQKGFMIRRIEEQGPLMRQAASDLIDRFIDDGRADFVADFTKLFPVLSLCRLLGVPDADIARFKDPGVVLHKMGAQPIAPEFPFIEAALEQLGNYVDELVRQRAAKPEADFISALIEAQETEGVLSREELVWNIANLLFAGQDTTRFQLANIMHTVITEPEAREAWERLAADPSLGEAVMWEGIRFYPSGQWGSRMTLEDVELGGFTFSKGQRVFLQKRAASRDPARFPDPHRFDIDRPERFNLIFGRGLHNCVGQVLARKGMEESLKVLAQRLKNVEIDGPVTRAKANAMVGGVESLPIRFTAR